MASQLAMNFSLSFQSDGVSTTLTFDAKNGALYFPTVAGEVLNPQLGATPSGVTGLGGSAASAVGTPTLVSLSAKGEATVQFPTAPPTSGNPYTLTGTLLY